MAPYLQLEHVFHAQQGFLRPLQEGRLAVGNIVNIGVKSRKGDEVEIEATVVRSTNINKEPVIVNVIIMRQEALNFPLLPWLGFSSDAVIFKDNVVHKLWENKTPVVERKVDASSVCAPVPYMDRDGKLRSKCNHYGQIQLGVILLNLEACDFTIYCSGPVDSTKAPKPQFDFIHVETVARNDSFCDKYLDRHVFFEIILPWLTVISQ